MFETLVFQASLHRGVQPRVQVPLCPPDLVRVADIRTAVTGIPHAVAIPVLLVTIGNSLAVVQNVFYSYEKGMRP